MKTLNFTIAFLFSLNLWAQTNNGEITTKDYNHNTITPTETSGANLSPEQSAEIQKQAEQIKQNQIESLKTLEELDKE